MTATAAAAPAGASASPPAAGAIDGEAGAPSVSKLSAESVALAAAPPLQHALIAMYAPPPGDDSASMCAAATANSTIPRATTPGDVDATALHSSRTAYSAADDAARERRLASPFEREWTETEWRTVALAGISVEARGNPA